MHSMPYALTEGMHSMPTRSQPSLNAIRLGGRFHDGEE